MRRRPLGGKWTEAGVARAVLRTAFKGNVLAVPCCGWTGHEADLLVVTRDLRLIDVEVKISRADLKADLQKEKWWSGRRWSRRAGGGLEISEPGERREWPPKVWKHYYVLPESVWAPSLEPTVPAASGILLVRGDSPARGGRLVVQRNAVPQKGAGRISAADAVDIARLAGLRMWDALDRLEAGRTAPEDHQ